MVLIANFKTFTILLFLRHAALNHASITRTQNSIRIRRPNSESPIQCTVFRAHYMSLLGEPELDPKLRCVADDGRTRNIVNFPGSFFHQPEFQSGRTRISVHASGVGNHAIDITAGSGKIITNISSRSNTSFDQNNNYILAVIRVSDKHDHSPDHTVAQISNNIFGTGGAPLNLVTGYQACSGNKVNFSPATGDGFSDGVMELQLTQNINGLSFDVVEDDVTNELSRNGFNPSTYTHVMYIFPKEVNFGGAAAYGIQYGHLSVFSNRQASVQYVLIHEIGHNFGHDHSGVEGISGRSFYADDTGMMGTQVRKDDMPRACFNAAKSWWFKWYADRHTEVIPTSGSATLDMLSIDDYLNGQVTSDDQYTIARIVGTNEDEHDLFVMYNRAEGINYDVAGHRNQVTIVRQNGHGTQSWLEAGIGFDDNVSSQWTKSNWDCSGNSLVIQICDKVAGTPDYARVIVYLEGVDDLSCGENTPSTCASGESKFKIGVLTDNHGDETKWWLKEQNSEGLYDNMILRDTQLRDNLYSEKEKCIDSSKCYKFKIRDEGKDGISGNGWYQIELDDKIIKHKDSTFEGSNEVIKVGVCN